MEKENIKEYENCDFSQETWRGLCVLKDRCNEIFQRRTEQAKAVIDLIAETVGVNDKGHYLYGLVDGTSPILEKINEYLDKGGDKVKLKKRIDELETENAVLRSLINK